MFKTDYHFESYLDTVYCRKYCMTLFNNGCGVLDINIENGRLNNIPRERRLCTRCITNNIEHEHQVLHVSLLQDNKTTFLKKSYCAWLSYYKFASLSKNAVLGLLKSIFYSMQRRTVVLIPVFVSSHDIYIICSVIFMSIMQ